MAVNALIIDDDFERAKGWAAKIPPELCSEPIVYTIEELSHLLDVLNGRRKRFRKEGVEPECGDQDIDGFDIVFVDHDLIDLDENIWGSDIAYLLSVFSSAKVICLLNKYSENDFDLTLRPRMGDHADLNMGDDQLQRPGLWSLDFSEFRPWSWPILPDLSASYDRRIDEAEKSLDSSLDQMIGIPLDEMPPSARDWLALDEGQKELSIIDWLRQTSGVLERKDQEKLERLVDEGDAPKRLMSRLAARYLYRMIDRLIIPTQEQLVDLPHLYIKAPGLFSGSDRRALRDSLPHISFSEKPPPIHDKMAKYIHGKLWWTGRQVFKWFEFVESVDDYMAYLISTDDDDVYVFLEDRSEFDHYDKARHFVADIEASDKGRYVDGTIGGVHYSPQSRFAL